MKVIAKFLVGLVLLVMVGSCTQERVDQNQLLKQEVIDIHDEVMPKMGELRSLKKSLLEQADALETENIGSNQEVINRMRQYAVDLENAFDGMFVWMRQFNSNFEGSEEEIHDYLIEQKILVEKVNRDIKTSIENARKELGS
jgi:hypothetical protein